MGVKGIRKFLREGGREREGSHIFGICRNSISWEEASRVDSIRSPVRFSVYLSAQFPLSFRLISEEN